MSILGSALGRALAGAGAGVASLANRYIDDEIARNRAEAMADLQRRTSKAIREDEDAFRNDPTRLARDRETKRQDLLAAGAAAREVERAGLDDTDLQTAREGQKDREAKADTRRRVDSRKTELTELLPAEIEAAGAKTRAEGNLKAELTKQYGNDPVYLRALRRQKEAEHIESSAASAQAELTRMRIEDEKRLGKLYDDLLALDSKQMPDADRAKEARRIQTQIAAIKSKTGGTAPDRTPTEKVEDEFGPDGSLIGRKRTLSGPAGSIPGDKASADPASTLRAGVERARADGKIGDAIAELRKAGASPAQILRAGVTEDELRAASQPRSRPIVDRAQSAGGPMAMLSDRDLQRLASIEGHAQQQAARDELARRAAGRSPIDTTGIGFGGSAAP